ncbi:MAG: IS110 family transposase [Candidatus Latescibacteria bacterium]|nr:IS110 family transposase [Candidatus Latescibacterota bacterium]NIO55414.1 IS110 family transposase [Candidatus Latescibacterota bacterium]
MWHVGIDLGRRTLYVAAVHDSGLVRDPVTIDCDDSKQILRTFKELTPFRAVIEATGTYRWLFRLLQPYGTVVLAHTLRLRAIVNRRSKTDKLDSRLLANLLRIDQIPLSYIPSDEYQYLREITRDRARLSRLMSEAKNGLRAILGRNNLVAPYRVPFGPRGLSWFAQQNFASADNTVRDELLDRITHYKLQMASIDEKRGELKESYPQVEALLDIRGIGLYLALLIVAETGDPERFRCAKQVGAYSGLTAKVNQSLKSGSILRGHVNLCFSESTLAHRRVLLVPRKTLVQTQTTVKRGASWIKMLGAGPLFYGDPSIVLQ